MGFDGKGFSESLGTGPDVENSFYIGLNLVGVLLIILLDDGDRIFFFFYLMMKTILFSEAFQLF